MKRTTISFKLLMTTFLVAGVTTTDEIGLAANPTFKKLDTDEDDLLSAEELQEFTAAKWAFSATETSNIIDAADADHDGMISSDEFPKILKSASKRNAEEKIFKRQALDKLEQFYDHADSSTDFDEFDPSVQPVDASQQVSIPAQHIPSQEAYKVELLKEEADNFFQAQDTVSADEDELLQNKWDDPEGDEVASHGKASMLSDSRFQSSVESKYLQKLWDEPEGGEFERHDAAHKLSQTPIERTIVPPTNPVADVANNTTTNGTDAGSQTCTARNPNTPSPYGYSTQLFENIPLFGESSKANGKAF